MRYPSISSYGLMHILVRASNASKAKAVTKAEAVEAEADGKNVPKAPMKAPA